MKIKIILSGIGLFATIVLTASRNAQNGQGKPSRGKNLFDQNCAACHHPTEQRMTSPFPFIRKKYGAKLVYQIIKNNASAQYYNKSVRRQFLNKGAMPVYEGTLTNKDIDDICDYVDQANSRR